MNARRWSCVIEHTLRELRSQRSHDVTYPPPDFATNASDETGKHRFRMLADWEHDVEADSEPEHAQSTQVAA